MKKKLMKLITQKEEKRAALQAKADASENVEELRSINTELGTLVADIAEMRSMLDAMDANGGEGAPSAGAGETAPQARAAGIDGADEGWQQNDPLGTPQQRSNGIEGTTVLGTYGVGQGTQEGRGQEDRTEIYEERGLKLKDGKSVTFRMEEMPELRAVSLASGQLVNEAKYSREINSTFNEVSGLVDKVNTVPLKGGESYTKSFEKPSGEGDYTTEDGEYTETDPEIDHVSINKAKITAYAEITDEAKKLPNINYQAIVRNHIGKSIRKKITRQIILGPGGANAIVGIFNAPVKVIPAESDITIAEIDENTLDEIVFGYGGDEDVEDNAYLILSKRDLAKFAALRSSDGKKLYKIELKGNTGTISSEDSFKVPYIINSACPVLSSDATATGTHCMAYGMLSAYEMPIYSDVEVEESRDYKFKTGQIAYRGAVWVGGNTAMYKGFVRVKKGAAV